MAQHSRAISALTLPAPTCVGSTGGAELLTLCSGHSSLFSQDFLKCLSIIEEVVFARVQAFAFSPLEGTMAYKLKDLPPDIKSERLHRLLAAGEEASAKYIKRFLNKPLDFIAEEYSEGFTTGYTPNYIKVYAPLRLECGKKYGVELTEIFKDGAYAKLITK